MCKKNVSRKDLLQAAVGVGAIWAFGISLLVSGCAKSADSSASTPIVDGLNTVDGKMQGAALLEQAQGVALGKPVKQTMFARLFGIASAEALPFNGQWDAPGTVNGLNWQNVSIKEYLGQALDSEFLNPNNANVTVFGRFRNEVRMLCAIDLLVPNKDADGLPANGSYALSVEVGPGTLLEQKCKGFQHEEAQTITGTITVSTPSPSTYYDKKLVFTMSGGTAPDEMPLYLKLDSQTIRIATMEIQSGRDARSRSFLEYDRANDVLRFEYLSQGFDANSGVEIHRIYIDGQAEQAYLLSNSGGSGAGGSYAGYVRFAAAGNPVDANRTTIAVSVGFDGQQGGNNVTDLNACVQASDGSITADDSLACQVTGHAISTATAVDASFATHATSADITLDASMTISFQDEIDVYTAVSQ